MPVLPAGAPRDVSEGAALFTARCSRCHSINLVGGTMGPELNVPRNVTEYWHEEALREFIADPSQVRAGSRMPASRDLTSRDVDLLLAYLRFMTAHKARVN
jgi:cytochrome c2